MVPRRRTDKVEQWRTCRRTPTIWTRSRTSTAKARADILLGNGTVKLGRRGRFIELTWNGDDEDLVDLVLQSAGLMADP